jgi:hypothetical protein
MSEKKFYIAGVQHHELHKVINQIEEGDELDLVQEPTNKFDPNAVRIEYQGTMCGYVPKKFSSEVSAMLYTGAPLCIVEKIDEKAKTWEQCLVRIEEGEALEEDINNLDEYNGDE